jgi:1-acyl-sn-glycerol-3-phosphate acyltransferase
MYGIRPLRIIWQRRHDGLRHVNVLGLESLREALAQGHGVLIISNHAAHPDPFVFLRAGDELGTPFNYMVAWQTLHLLGFVGREILRRHGCFSVDRDSNDFRAFRQSVDILQHSRHPLVMFPEGEIYHNNLRLVPFRTGTATIALTAAKFAERRVVCVPAAIRYRYVVDPTPQLLQLMEDLEKRLTWQPRPDLPLARRIYRVAEGVVSLKELEYLGSVQGGEFSTRTLSLADTILQGMEKRYQTTSKEPGIAERVTNLRRWAIKNAESLPPEDPRRAEALRDLEDLCVTIQLFSYSQDYVEDRPNFEHVAEILDKFEEDVLGAPTATVRGARDATILFGEAVEVKATDKIKEEVHSLTETLQQRVRALLEEIDRRATRDPSASSPVHGLQKDRDADRCASDPRFRSSTPLG